MFENVGFSEVLILLVVALFVLGPERLPDAAAWLGRSIRKVRNFASGASRQLRDEIGPEYEHFREPIAELRKLRSFDPKRAVTDHLFDGDEDPLGLNGDNGSSSNGDHRPPQPPASEPLKAGEKPPVDPDAT